MIAKFRTYRARIDQPGVKPISFAEWLLGRASGKLQVAAATMATKRKDLDSLSHALLAIWARNQSKGNKIDIRPAELSKAIREDRVHIVIDPPAGN